MSRFKFANFALVAAMFGATVIPSVAHAQQQSTPAPQPPARDPIRLQQKDDFTREYTQREALYNTPEGYGRAVVLALPVSKCLVSALGEDAGTLLGGPMTDDERFDRLSKALSGESRKCISGEAQGLPVAIVNGALAESLLVAQSPELSPRVMDLNQNDADAFTTMAPGVKMNFDIIGRCAAVYSPGLTLEVLKTDPGGKDEKVALDKLYASTPECGLRAAPEGAPTAYQRGVLATGLYHWLHRG